MYTLLSGLVVYTLFPCFPRKTVYTIAFFALRPQGRATDREKRGATVVVCTLSFPAIRFAPPPYHDPNLPCKENAASQRLQKPPSRNPLFAIPNLRLREEESTPKPKTLGRATSVRARQRSGEGVVRRNGHPKGCFWTVRSSLPP